MMPLPPHYASLAGLQPANEAPQPPFHVRMGEYVWMGVQFDPDAVRHYLPKDLNPADGCTGIVGAYEAVDGSGIAPYSALYVAIEVMDHPSADGSPGLYMPAGFYSDKAFLAFNGSYSATITNGHGFVGRDGALIAAGGGRPGETDVRFGFTANQPVGIEKAGFHDYLGTLPDGRVSGWTVAYTATGAVMGGDIHYDVTSGAPEVLHRLRPAAFLWAARVVDLNVTLGPPHQANGPRPAAEEATMSLLAVLNQIGRAALIVGSDGQVLRSNAAALDILGDGVTIRSGRLMVSGEQRQAALTAAIASAAGGAALALSLNAVAVPRTQHDAPLFVRVLPAPSGVGVPAAIVLITEPDTGSSGDPVPALQLMGLTPAEARLAAKVGSGLTARAAAEGLAITEHTARSSLKVIYDKLAVAKQSELARIVTRLESLGA